ncbi:HPP family protein [Zoogloea sp.]|uniref:HPP family protein n=1 Tax=Zoogloea sp. TaxID=49181 RepID=UPI002CD594E2|nr:HPP family protein [Zoogloea sp.]
MDRLPFALTRFARRYLVADAAPLSRAERLRSTVAALAGLLIYEAVLLVLPVAPEARRALAPLGATAVILFTLPHSPLAQPWSVAGGLLLPALTGLICGSSINAPLLAAAVAVGLSVGIMGWLRCIHPPGGAMALVMTAHALQGQDAATGLAAVGWNVLAMLIAATAVNNALPGRRYPLCSPPVPQLGQPRPPASGISEPDLAAALQEMDTYLDVSEDDLSEVFGRAARHAFHRHVLLTCGAIAQPAPVSLAFATDLNEAWRLMRVHGACALPVVDRIGRPEGVLGLEDFLRHVDAAPAERLGDNVRRLLRPTPGPSSDKPEVVGQIMHTTRHGLRMVRETDGIAVAAEILSSTGQAVLPVVNDAGRLTGVISRPHITAVLFRHEALAYVRNDRL